MRTRSRIVPVALGLLILAPVLLRGSGPVEPTAEDRADQLRTMSALATIGQVIEAYRADHETFPVASSAEALAAKVEPVYIRQLPRQDAWGYEFSIDVVPDRYTIASCGKGTVHGCTPALSHPRDPAAMSDPRHDIIYADGEWVQRPPHTAY